MNVLILGGTRFLGRHIADALIEHGHTVTLFNRGVSDPVARERIGQIHGDRERDLSLLAGRMWDAVVDTCCYRPQTAQRSSRFFDDCTARYVFVSTISVHDLSAEAIITEETPQMREPREEYGPAKALCETIVRSTFRHRATIVRPGLIVGPYDPTDRFTYWPVRVDAGGDVLAPVAPSEPAQFIDVRDLSQFIVHTIEMHDGGTYNVTSPRGHFTIGEVLETCARVSGSGARFVWADEQFLKDNDVSPWMDLPLWVGANSGARSIVNADVRRALTAGLTIRPLHQTVRDTLAWARASGKRWGDLKAGLSPKREGELLQRLTMRA
ncbi:MAG TPA: NAD-dependent epimerase/dehydratase family protein [Candidatus Baltobacteraceae bacterium]|jgi:2'-hydroxyisoflavone reductase|nr:NAD-dependent epimerase/dehydratase family protein [Candidatus Baltobacteraceae bacterium]